MSSTALDPAIVPLTDQVPFGKLNAATLAEVRATPLVLPGELSDAVERVDHVVSEAPRVSSACIRRRRSRAGRGCASIPSTAAIT